MRISDWSSDVCSSDLFTGKYLDEITLPDDEGPVLESYQLVSESKCAVLTRMKWHLDANTIGEYDACFLPLSENGRTVDKALGMECYENVERNFTLGRRQPRSEEHTSELQSLMRTSYAVFCLKKKKNNNTSNNT